MSVPGIEIERRFKLTVPASQLSQDSYLIGQWYLPNTGSWTIRCRKYTYPQENNRVAYDQTLKRDYHELEASMNELQFDVMRARCYNVGVTKERFHKPLGDRLWELDVYSNPDLMGLQVAEVELPSIDSPLIIPDWVGCEITGVRCFSNISLCRFLNNIEQSESLLATANYFNLKTDSIATFATTRVVDLFDPMASVYSKDTSIRRIVAIEKGISILNDAEHQWLRSDPDITLLDIALTIALIRRKHAKKK